MAVNLSVKYPVGTNAPDADYPFGSAANSTTSETEDGFPLDKDWSNDLFAMMQGLLWSSFISPNGSVDSVNSSQYLSALSGFLNRSLRGTDAGIANAYGIIKDPRQHIPPARFNGMRVKFIPGDTNTGPSTVDVFGFGVSSIKLSGGVADALPGQIIAGLETELIDRLTYYELVLSGDHAHSAAVIEVAVDADITLTAGQSQRGEIVINDNPVTLTGAVSVIMLNTPRLFTAVNNTAQVLTFKTAAGTGVAIPAGQSMLLMSNGVDITTPFSQVNVDRIGNAAGASVPTSDLFLGRARSWLTFNGTGAVAIRASYNVVALTDAGVGTYDVTMASGMGDIDYAVLCTDGASGNYTIGTRDDLTPQTQTQYRVSARIANTGAAVDIPLISTATFGN